MNNTRIQELIRTKSTILFPGTDVVDCTITDIEKFAELIVRECLDITDAHKKVFQTHQDKAFIEYIKQSVKTHFGLEVEE